MQFVLNGQSVSYDGDQNRKLIDYLRNSQKLKSIKAGCGQGACGSCTVCVDGKAMLSCITPMKKIAGKTIVTAEGIGDDFARAFKQAFVVAGGIQCGFCTPAIMLRAYILFQTNTNPTRDDIKATINPNLCRCTGYIKIIDSILLAGQILFENKTVEHDKTARIGARYPKYDSMDAVVGQRPFVADMEFANMAYGALRFSDHPKAKIIKVDTSKAEKVDGVLRVFTAKDIPGERVIGLIKQDWPMMVAEGETTSFVGDVVAGVVATSEEIARKAATKIDVVYGVQEPVCFAEDAVKDGATKVHADQDSNILSHSTLKTGDVEKSFAQAAYVVQDTFYTQRIEHAFLEPECCTAVPVKDGKFNVYSQGQGVYVDLKQLCKVTGLAAEKINVIQVQNGGGFGGKEDMTVQHHATVYAMLLGQPVQVALSREQSLVMHPKRHPMRLDYKLACDKDGRLTALKCDILGDTGAYASVGMKVLERAAGHASGAYDVPNIDLKATAVYTNNVPCGAMRGFGVNQAAFAMESCIDALCEKGGFDRWQFRYNNALAEGRRTATGQKLGKGCGLRKTLDAVKDDFTNAKYAGIACGIKNTGVGNGMPDISKVRIKVRSPECIEIHHGWTEMGQGVHTIALQTVCDITGIPAEKFMVKNETKLDVETGMTTSSRGTSLVGNALIIAARKLKKELENNDLKSLVGKEYEAKWECDWTNSSFKGEQPNEPVTHYSYSFATQVVVLDDNGNINHVIAAHDAGKVMNKTLFEGQVEGGVHMGLGYALSEDCPWENARPKHTKFGKLGILRAKEMPDVKVICVEERDPNGPFGAKGVGEIGLVPTAAAVANAFTAFDGKRRTQLPLLVKNKEKKI